MTGANTILNSKPRAFQSIFAIVTPNHERNELVADRRLEGSQKKKYRNEEHELRLLATVMRCYMCG